MSETEVIYYNGDIITMEDGREAEAVFIKCGKIEAVGAQNDIFRYRSPETKLVNLQGRTLMPAFLDAHSHISALTQTLSLVDLSACKTIPEIIEKLKGYQKERNISKGKWIVGFGYDHNFLEEKRHPNREDLDKVSKDNPIMISHVSGHMGIVNSLGLGILEIDEQTIDPVGGRYGRIQGTSIPNGYLEESAFISKASAITEPDPEEVAKDMQLAQEIYLQNGITTVQDGLVKRKDLDVLKYMAEHHQFKVDVVAYVDVTEKENNMEAYLTYDRRYDNHLKIGGYKLVLDGSPQGKTAWLTEPYEGEESYRGSRVHGDEYVQQIVNKAFQEERQLLTHCNGDGAADQLIHAVWKAEERFANYIRPVMIHAQIIRKDQIKKMKELGIIPSYFIAHTYYWGDVHIKNLGERAFRISPAASSQKEDLLYTFHQDTPVIAPNMFETIWCAVNRITRDGVSIGTEEKISVYDAMKAVTCNVAYQYFEEASKGSISEGKNADFIIIDKNPLKMDKKDIKKIKVLETIKDGQTIWSAK